jgi:hypothetical protein
MAECASADPDLFFTYGKGEKEIARKICGRCWVAKECLVAAMREEQAPEGESPRMNLEYRHGIRAGLTATERWRLAYPGLNPREKAAA